MADEKPRYFVQCFYGLPWHGAEPGGNGRGDRFECESVEQARTLRAKLADPKYGNTSVKIEVL